MMKKVSIFLAIVSLLGCSKAEGMSAPMHDSVEMDNGTYYAKYMEGASKAIKMSDAEVTITKSGTYSFSGNYTNISVDVNKDIDEGIIYLVLDNVNIENIDGTPIHIIEGQEVVIVLQGENTIEQGSITTEDDDFPSAALYSSADTVITGDGSLELITLFDNGINSRDDLIIENTTISVTAPGHGIIGKDLLSIINGNITVHSGQDGLKASNDEDEDKGKILITNGTFEIHADNDAISAESLLQIDNGSFNLSTGGGFYKVLDSITIGEGPGNTVQPSSLLEDSMKGLKSNDMIIHNGIFTISTYEDAIHANNDLTINGGTFTILSGDDAVHADENLVINDIQLTVEDAYEGIEGATVTINGGNIDVSVLDDAMNANEDYGYVEINGGTIHLRASGDGIDSNGDLRITGGHIVLEVDALYARGDGDIDVSGEYSHTGGTLVDENGNPTGPRNERGRPRRF